jgi:hypothetical protein
MSSGFIGNLSFNVKSAFVVGFIVGRTVPQGTARCHWSGRVDLNDRPLGPEEGGRKHLSAASGVAYGTARPLTLLLKWTEVERLAPEWVASLVSLVREIAGTSRRPNRIVELLHWPSAHLAFVNVRASNPWGDRHFHCVRIGRRFPI